MTYFVTYAVMSTEAGANPFWHAILLFSEQPTPASPIQVMDALGFYSESPSSSTNPIIRGLKHILGFKIDLQDGHGHLKKEEIRYLDGLGLYGISFNVSQLKYNNIKKACHDAMAAEDVAIKQLSQRLLDEGRVANAHTRYMEEMALAESEGRPSRLKPFHVTMKLTRSGFNTQESYTCKARALDFLLDSAIINQEIYNKITGGQTAHAFPRCSGLPLPPIQLVSTGEPEAQPSKRTGNMFYNRSWKHNNPLYWTSSPRTLGENLSPSEVKKRGAQDLKRKNILFQVREIELLLLKKIATYDEKQKNNPYLLNLIIQLKRIQTIFLKFSVNNFNQGPWNLKLRLFDAETKLNIARVTLNRNLIDHSFIQRASRSGTLGYAILGFVTVIMASIILTGIVGIIATIGATLFAFDKLNQYIKKEIAEATMRADYTRFHSIKPKKIDGMAHHNITPGMNTRSKTVNSSLDASPAKLSTSPHNIELTTQTLQANSTSQDTLPEQAKKRAPVTPINISASRQSFYTPSSSNDEIVIRDSDSASNASLPQ